MEKNIIGIIGAGDIGLNLAEILALRGYKVIIYNRYHAVDGFPSPYWLSKMGKIMDMNDSLQLPYCKEVILTSELNDLEGADFVVITAGSKRTSPEETREELAGKNAKIIETYVDFIIENPTSLYLIVSNPVDFLTQYLIEKIAEKTNKNHEEIARKIVGVSYIDSMRLKNLVKEFFSKFHSNMKDIVINNTRAIGEHGPSMVPVMSNITINGKKLAKFANVEQINYIREHTILRGNDIIKLTGASSVMGPAHAVMYMIDEMVTKENIIIPASVWDGKRCIGRIAKFAGNIFKEIIDIDMSEEEQSTLSLSEESLDRQYQTILNLIN